LLTVCGWVPQEDEKLWQTVLISTHCLTGGVAHITFSFTGTGPPRERRHAVVVQREWRRKQLANHFNKLREGVRKLQRKWRAVLAMRLELQEARRREELVQGGAAA